MTTQPAKLMQLFKVRSKLVGMLEQTSLALIQQIGRVCRQVIMLVSQTLPGLMFSNPASTIVTTTPLCPSTRATTTIIGLLR